MIIYQKVFLSENSETRRIYFVQFIFIQKSKKTEYIHRHDRDEWRDCIAADFLHADVYVREERAGTGYHSGVRIRD